MPTSRTYVQIIRTNILNFFNIILFSISLLLLLLGDPKNAFFTGVIA